MKRGIGVATLVAAAALCLPGAAQDYPRYPSAGSTYVPLHSWVYPALERLAALRLISSDFRGIKPWTRTECARLTEEAGEAIAETLRGDEEPRAAAVEIYRALEREFADELESLGGGPNRSFGLESAYARVLSLSGPTLTDGYHFGQTTYNDYGRPNRRGTNVITGASFRGTWGPFFAYGSGEYQHAPSAPAMTEAQRNLIAQQDVVPVPPATPFAEVNRFRVLDSYIGVNFRNWQLSFGRQSLWWGTSESGPLLLSNNAEPVTMVRLTRVVPFKLPGLLRIFGPVRTDFFVGRLGGHKVSARPWLQGQRIGLKPTRSFEFGVTHTVIFGGKGRPNGLDVFFKSMIGLGERRENFGDQHLSFDFLYRFGRYATLYSEFLGSDDPYPFSAPRRMAVNSGVYFPRLPGLDRVDLRLEGFYTESPCEPRCAGPGKTLPAHFLHYWHYSYPGGYTNNGFILGNAIGRSGVGFQGWTSYWFSPTHRLQLSFRRSQVSGYFVPQGAHWSDFAIRHERDLKAGFYVRSLFQVEHLRFPFLFPSPRTNVAASVELGYAREMLRH